MEKYHKLTKLYKNNIVDDGGGSWKEGEAMTENVGRRKRQPQKKCKRAYQGKSYI